jgi:hypothetical protein
MRINIYNILHAGLLTLGTSTAFAAPNQLDVLGLVAGVSDSSQVQNAGIKISKREFDDPNSVLLKIGGHVVSCNASFLSGKLSLLTCLTGTDNRLKFTEASNTEVHADLSAGFTKKFGKPNSKTSEPVRTGNGVKYINNSSSWTDKQGNKLDIMSIAGNVNMGLIAFQSSEYLKQAAKKETAREADKKF